MTGFLVLHVQCWFHFISHLTCVMELGTAYILGSQVVSHLGAGLVSVRLLLHVSASKKPWDLEKYVLPLICSAPHLQCT